jgi:LysM repeat protein
MSATPLGKFVGLVLAVGVVVGGVYAYKTFVGNKQAQQSAYTPPLAPTPEQAPAPAADFKPSADTLQSILTNHVVRISVENPSEPIYGENQGVPHGFNYEFAKLLFAQPEFTKNGPVTVDTHHEVTTYQDVPRQLLAGGSAPMVDIAMDGLTFPDNTPAGVVYTVPYLDDFGYALIVQSGSSIRSTADLQGKTVGVLQGDPDVLAFVQRTLPGVRVVPVSDADPHFIDKSVDNHIVDAFVYDYPFAVESVKGTDLKFAVTKLDGSDISYKIGVRAADQSLMIYLNSAIAKVKSTPAYLDLLRRYFISDQVVTTAAASGERTYTVKHGDTLNLIASAQLGSGSRYTEIQKRNNLPNPNLIQVGQHLVIPQR